VNRRFRKPEPPGASSRPPARRGRYAFRVALAALVALALGTSSCAYYNTFYLAKRYYATATGGLPYAVDKPGGAQAGNYQKSIDYSKKVIANYPKSKWVDDAYLLWAQALLGKEDPLQSINMLEDFDARFPDSPRKDDARFYLGVAYRQARKYREALVPLDEFLERAPASELAPYAHLERSRALMSLDRPAEAAQAASQVIDRFPNSSQVDRARAERAEALLASRDPAKARADFQALGLRAADDNQRFTFLLREADCLEAARDYDAGLALLNDALSHEPVPVKGGGGAAPTGAAAERYGRLTLRIGTLHAMAGRSEEALAAYGRVLADYPKTALAAEAQYRIAYTYETVLDDFETARLEYGKVRDQSVGSPFSIQAVERQQSLERLARFRSAEADSAGREAEAGFLLAEQYLFQLDKPERALEVYEEIAREHAGTPVAGKALNASAWVLSRKLDRPAEAETLFWTVVRDYPATEAQLAARDYLEAAGQQVPTALIRLPEPTPAPPDSAATAPGSSAGAAPTIPAPRPPEPPGAWPVRAVGGDSLATGAPLPHGSSAASDSARTASGPAPAPAAGDTTRAPSGTGAPADSSRVPAGHVRAPGDTLRVP